MNGMRTARRLLALAALLAVTASCGDVARNSRSPVYLVVDSLLQGANNTILSDVQTLVITPAPCSALTPCATIFNDMASVSMHISPKDIGVPAFGLLPSDNNQVTITRYHVTYRRADGRNTPGVDVPYGFDGAATVTVTPSGGGKITFEIVRHAAKEESPLVQLIISRTIITTIAEVTFYGTDLAGNEISATGSITIDFGNFGDS